MSPLRREPLGVPREQRGLANVVEAAVQHHDALQSNAGASVGRGAKLERVDVGLDGVNRDAACNGARCG